MFDVEAKIQQITQLGDLESLEELRCLLEERSINAPFQSGWTVLLHACNNGSDIIVKFLLESGAKPNVHCEFFTPLMAVCNSSSSNQEKLVKCAKSLIERGADVNAMDKFKTTALMFACTRGHEQLISVLFDAGCEINKIDNEGSTALHMACLYKHSSIVRLLLDQGAEKIIKDRRGRIPLDLATSRGADDIMELLDVSFGDQTQPQAVYEKTKTSFEELLTKLPSYHNSSGKDGFHDDIESLLFGLRLGHQHDLFKSKRVSLAQFLNLKNDELKDLGLHFSSHRERIINGNKRFLSRSWGSNSLAAVKKKEDPLDIMEIVRSLANVVKHLHIIWASSLYCNERITLPTDEKDRKATQLSECLQTTLGQNNAVLKELKIILSQFEQLDKINEVHPADLILPSDKPTPISIGKIFCVGAASAFIFYKTNMMRFCSWK